MAIVQKATLTPSKMELLQRWLPTQAWFGKNVSADLSRIGSFRFDDPAGEVGIETILVASENTVFQVPLTYRGSPLPEAEPFLIGTMEHSILGTRWIYDAAGDPVYISALAAAILTGHPQADQAFELEGRLELIPESVHLQTTGTPTTSIPTICSTVSTTLDGVTAIYVGDQELSVNRVLNFAKQTPKQRVLAATWDRQTMPVELASLARARQRAVQG
ncbi:hypothetical protein PUN71_020810 [Arthrobacter sp. NQ7]|uniref:CG0192-related protein n=1 Tax=Arthrobacter sp. NQ7 TaxID=3032303 RepID=UPI0024105D60|nr:hypothetical protein [Arthrobacter sp. NQ7]MDJ0459655.1 hypothetical protein [Arthrobacter sp. NQ7]